MRVRKLTWSIAAITLATLGIGGWAATGHPLPGMQGPRADSLVFADSARNACRSRTADKQACYEAILLPLVGSHGVRTAMGTLNRLASLDPYVRSEGHVFAHGIGILAGKSGRDMAQTFASCTEILQSGCYHGVIQAYFEGVHHIDTGAVNALCQPYTTSESQRWLRFQCVHGMGHGLTMYYAWDLPRALEGCDLLRDGWDRESCYGGAFMENIVNATMPHHVANRLVHITGDSAPAPAEHAGHGGDSAHDEHADHAAPAAAAMAGMEHQHAPAAFKAMDSTDLQYPCSIMADRYLDACYMMQTSIILRYVGGDMSRAARACLQAPLAMRYVCHQSLGRDISSYAQQDHRNAIRMCSVAESEYQPWCHIGMVKNLIDLTAKPEDGMSYCREVPGRANKLKCYEAVGEQIAALRATATEREAACATAERQFTDACRFGAQITGVARPAGLPQARS